MTIRSIRLSTKSWDHHGKRSPPAHVQTWAGALPAPEHTQQHSPALPHAPAAVRIPRLGTLLTVWVFVAVLHRQSVHLENQKQGKPNNGRRHKEMEMHKEMETFVDLAVQCHCLWQQKTWCCIIILRAQPDFNKIDIKPVCSFPP